MLNKSYQVLTRANLIVFSLLHGKRELPTESEILYSTCERSQGAYGIFRVHTINSIGRKAFSGVKSIKAIGRAIGENIRSSRVSLLKTLSPFIGIVATDIRGGVNVWAS